MGRLTESNASEYRPWPDSPAEEYLTAYEYYLIGAVEKEPALPDGLSAEELDYIAAQAEYMDFRADNGLWNLDDEVAFGMYVTLNQIRNS